MPKTAYSELSASRSLPSSGPSFTTVMRVTSSRYSSQAALRSASTGAQVPLTWPMNGILMLTLICEGFIILLLLRTS